MVLKAEWSEGPITGEAMARRVVLVLLVTAAMLATVRGVHARNAGPPHQGKPAPKVVFSNPPPSEMVHIDGSKNPEMIPEWRAWWQAFHIMAGGPRQVPSVVREHLTENEASLLLKAAQDDQKYYTECEARVMKLAPLLQTEEAKTINERTREINLDCRRHTLQLRDSVLAAFSPEGQAALKRWVDATKAGMKESVPKRELAFYRQPQ
jgi:hypothetical protein